MIDTLLLPFQFPFMVKAMAITFIVAVPMALLSCFLILKGWALMGDAISHAIFPGVVVGYMITPSLSIFAIEILAMLGLNSAALWFEKADLTMICMTFGAFCAGMFCAVATGFLQENSRIKQDTVMGIVFSGMFGFGLLLFSNIESDLHLNHILFGHMLGVNWFDIAQTFVLVVVIVGLLLVKWRDFLLYCFDPIQARAVGLKVQLLHYMLLAMISLTIVAALKVVGIILSISLLIAPGAIAYLVTRKFASMLIVAVIIAVAASFLGTYLSLFIGSDSAATIVLIMTIVFIIIFIMKALTTAKRQQATAAEDSF